MAFDFFLCFLPFQPLPPPSPATLENSCTRPPGPVCRGARRAGNIFAKLCREGPSVAAWVGVGASRGGGGAVPVPHSGAHGPESVWTETSPQLMTWRAGGGRPPERSWRRGKVCDKADAGLYLFSLSSPMSRACGAMVRKQRTKATLTAAALTLQRPTNPRAAPMIAQTPRGSRYMP